MADIEHVFVLMMENRSYDNLLGYSGFKGKDPRTGKTVSANDLTTSQQFNLSARNKKYAVTKGAPYSLGRDPGHEFTDMIVALSGLGTLPKSEDKIREAIQQDLYKCQNGVYPAPQKDPNKFGFALAYDYEGAKHPDDVLKCFSPEQLPVLNTLAKEYVVCDNWFCAMPGPTWPNRFFALCGSSGGLDHSPTNNRAGASSALRIDGFEFQYGNIFEKFGDDWLVAYGKDDFAQAGAIKALEKETAGKHFVYHADLYRKLREGTLESKFTWIEPSYDSLANYRFGNSMHPNGDVRWGEAFIKEFYENLRKSKYWEKSVLLVVFDENGGFFDHAVPPGPDANLIPGDKPTDPDNNKHDFKFDALGPRVPALIISPWVEKGGVDKTLYHHGSIIKTASEMFGFKPEMGNRVDGASSFLPVLTRKTPRTDAPEVLPEPAWNWLSKAYWEAVTYLRDRTAIGPVLDKGRRVLDPFVRFFNRAGACADAFRSVAARMHIEKIRKDKGDEAAQSVETAMRALKGEKEIEQYLKKQVGIYRKGR